MGAVATTFLAGCFLARRGMASPTGSITQLGTIRLGKRTDDRVPLIKDFVPLASLDDLGFRRLGPLSRTTRSRRRSEAAVLEDRHLAPIASRARGHPADASGVLSRRRETPSRHARKEGDRARPRWSSSSAKTSARSRKNRASSALVAVWCGSTERYVEPGEAHQTIANFERGLERDDPSITGSALYAWACLKEGVPYANGAPNLSRRLSGGLGARSRHERAHLPARTSRPARR